MTPAPHWQGRERFVVLAPGFGQGRQFLATWDAWRRDVQRSAALSFISIESQPPTQAELASALADSPYPALAEALLKSWPPATPNLHRLDFDDAKVQLLLAVGDTGAWLRELVATVDAFRLDDAARARGTCAGARHLAGSRRRARRSLPNSMPTAFAAG